MKLKIFTNLLFILIIITIGCKKENSNQIKNNEKVTTIVTSFYPMYIFTLNITKNIPDVEVVNMTKPQTGCLHDYQLTPDDLNTLENAQIFVVNGAGMEAFMDKVIQQMPNLKIVQAGNGIKLIKDANTGEENPHIWVSISNAIQQVKNIGDQLSVLDSKNASLYKKNITEYVKKLEELKAKMHNALDNIKNRDIITFHEAFPYFAKEFNLNIVSIIEREPGTAPSAKELSDTIALIKKTRVKALFAEPQYSAKTAETIAKETGIKLYTLDPVVTGEIDADAYISIMKKNFITLEEALCDNSYIFDK